MKILITSLFLLLITTSAFAQKQLKPWMGVHIEKVSNGVLIKKAVTDTPAFRAGFKAGDIVQSIDDVKVSTPAELIQIIQSKGVGHKVKIKYLDSKKKEKETTLALEAMPGILDMAKKNLLNKLAPDFNAKVFSNPNKKEFSLSKEIGKVKVIEFWATWCGACMQAHPIVSQFASENKKNITVISISDEEPRLIKKFLHHAKKNKHTSNDVLFLQAAKTKIMNNYFVPALPMFLVLDKKNKVRFLTIGTGNNLNQAFEMAKSLVK
jgi:thiol-disulfide isomerase/thioredoxin